MMGDEDRKLGEREAVRAKGAIDDDAQGHAVRGRYATGEEPTGEREAVRAGRATGEDAEGHAWRGKYVSGDKDSDSAGHGMRPGRADDTADEPPNPDAVMPEGDSGGDQPPGSSDAVRSKG